MKVLSDVRMRPPDPGTPDLYVMEELAKPRASLAGSRIAVWIYHDGPVIREIILSGHTESATCRSATSILIEAAKELDSVAEWMLTCGAAYIKLVPESTPFPLLHRANTTLQQMLQSLGELAVDTGQLELIHQDWQVLARFRNRFSELASAPHPQMVLPNAESQGAIADYLPIMPASDANEGPLVFELEGWDFDCPEFQAVADRHLRSLQRELLRDALRRRHIYRGWLKEWTQWWVPRIAALPNSQASDLALRVPLDAESDSSQEQTTAVSVPDFLSKQAGAFLDRGQTWHEDMARVTTNYTLANYPLRNWINLFVQTELLRLTLNAALPEREKLRKRIDLLPSGNASL